MSGRLRQALEAHRLRTGGGSREQASARAIELLTAAARRVADWPLEGDGFEARAPGAAAHLPAWPPRLPAMSAEPTAEDLHEWRKRAKDLWYHLTPAASRSGSR